MKTISIIIATYNASSTISQCLDSIVRQKTDEVELLVIDGASKDDTIGIVRQYGNSVDVFISEPDKGLYDAWNKGVKMSSGKWIMFVGADDLLTNDALPSYLEFLSNNDTRGIDFITAKAIVVDNRGELLYNLGKPYNWEEFRKTVRISHGSSLHSRDLFKEVGLFDTSYKICADYELLLRKKLNALFMDKLVFIMRDGGCSTTNKALDEAFRAKRQHNSQSILGCYYLKYRSLIGNTLRSWFPCLKKLK